MRRLLKWLLILLVIAGCGYAAWLPAQAYWRKRSQPEFLTAEADKGSIQAVVNATGEVKPTLSVEVGSFASGPIVWMKAEFNEEVEEGQVLARVDRGLYEPAVERDQASLASRKADVRRIKAELNRAINDEERARELYYVDQTFVSQDERDELRFNRMSWEAQLALAEAAVDSAEANLRRSAKDLELTEIKAPVDGMIIERRIEPGATLASSFQTPVLFVIAPRMREEVHVFASVDEADIGMVRRSWEQKRPVHFTVDAYPEELFEGAIHQIRFSKTELQTVVTYPVVVSAANPELKLLPGMTANISFEVDREDDVVRIPNSALRFYPEVEHVREQDKKLLEVGVSDSQSDEQQAEDEMGVSATARAELQRARNRRHCWVPEPDGKLRAIELLTGISDHKHTELVEGQITPGMKLVTGVKQGP